ncbi:MAG: glycoside hydrolase family 16 protein [Bacteroidota bacterium]
MLKTDMKIRISLLLTVIVALALFSACEQSDPPIREFSLVWADEFNGDELDRDKWDVQLGDGSDYGLWRWGNEEDQYYQAENVSVANGFLRIAAVADSVAGYGYTSGRIRTVGSGDFKYGRIEASIRMDNTPGLWHAFWMLPTDPTEPWPVSGEIDIMEYVGNSPNEVLTTIHFADPFGNRNLLGNSFPFQPDGNFHVYTTEWDQNKIVWYYDETEVFEVLRTNDAVSNTWPFDAAFHLLLNVAVGGNLGGNVNAAALQAPKLMEVDYVRVYQSN